MVTIQNLEKLRSSQLMNGFAGVDGFTPLNLVIEQFDRIPLEWSNPNLKFSIPAAAHGTYGIVAYWRFMEGLQQVFINENERSRHILENILYLNEINPWLCRQLRIQGFINVIEGDYLEYKTKMKFDAIVGNPPYQEKVGPNKTEPLWNKFVIKSFDLVKDGGYVSLIHPISWRSSAGKFKVIQKLLKENQVLDLVMNDFDKGYKTFGVGTNFDYYVAKKTKKKTLTNVQDIDGNVKEIDLTKLEFIPNGMFNEFLKLIAAKNEPTVNVLYSRSAYGTDKNNMSSQINDEMVFPCVYTITQKTGINLFYSNTTQNGHFGIPKVIWSNGLGTYPILDEDGIYGLTQFSYGIVDTIENLRKIKTAMESENFLKLMSYVKYTNNKYDYKIISTFKKDFWKEFINE